MNEAKTARERREMSQRRQEQYRTEREIAKAAGYDQPNDVPGGGRITCLICGNPVVEHPLVGAHPEIMSDRPMKIVKWRDR